MMFLLSHVLIFAVHMKMWIKYTQRSRGTWLKKKSGAACVYGLLVISSCYSPLLNISIYAGLLLLLTACIYYHLPSIIHPLTSTVDLHYCYCWSEINMVLKSVFYSTIVIRQTIYTLQLRLISDSQPVQPYLSQKGHVDILYERKKHTSSF